MEWIEYIWDGLLVLAGLVCLAWVLIRHSRFHLPAAIPACLACCAKGARMLCYKIMMDDILILENTEEMMEQIHVLNNLLYLLDAISILLLFLSVFFFLRIRKNK